MPRTVPTSIAKVLVKSGFERDGRRWQRRTTAGMAVVFVHTRQSKNMKLRVRFGEVGPEPEVSEEARAVAETIRKVARNVGVHGVYVIEERSVE